MAKIPSRKFATAKKKIASTKFSTAKKKLSSGKPASQTSKIPSRKFTKAKKATKQVVNASAPLGHPTDEQAREKVVATLKGRTDALKAEEDSRSPDNSNFSTFEGNLFGVLFGFHKKAMDLLRNSGLKDDKLKLVSERITQLLADVTAETKRTRNLDLAGLMDLAYEEVKSMVEELSSSTPGR